MASANLLQAILFVGHLAVAPVLQTVCSLFFGFDAFALSVCFCLNYPGGERVKRMYKCLPISVKTIYWGLLPMENFRKRARDNRRHTVDGIMGAPVRPTAQPVAGSRQVRLDGLRSSTRRIGDFTRADGYHPTTSNGVRAAAPPVTDKKDQAAKKASLLHMTLPTSGVLGSSKKKDRKANGGRQSRWRTFRKWGLRSALVAVALTILVGGVLVTKGILKINQVFKGGGSAAALENDVKPELLKGEGDGRVNILLMGKGGPGHEGADLTDTLIVSSIDPINKTSTLVSIPRDLWVTVPGSGSGKINAVYANAKNKALNSNPKDKAKAEQAGVEAIKQAVGQALGIPIHYYSMIDFEGFKQAVDIVGGVDINVPEDLAVSEHLYDTTVGKPYYLNVPAGPQHFDSTKALYFSRSRKTSLRGDFTRAERQRVFIQALGQKVLSAGTYTNPVKISQLMSAFGDHVTTDFSVNNAIRLAQIGKDIDISKMQSIGLADPPENLLITDQLEGQSIVRPAAGLGDFSKVQSFIRNTLKDPYIAKENAAIVALNGTGKAGLATTKSDQLKSYGYNVTRIGDAPTQTYDKTVIVDMTNGQKPFTKNYLEKRLGAQTVTTLPDATIDSTGADFVIILGQDATTN